MRRPVWKHLESIHFGLARRISQKILLQERLVPGFLTDLRFGRELLVACDFGGSHQAARYESYSFLVGAVAGSQEWEERRREVRSRIVGDERRMSYKRLNDAIRAKALVPFLNAADRFPGVLVTFLIDRQVPSLIGDHGLPDYFPELVIAQRGWNQKAFHRLCLVASLGSLLVSGLSAEDQDILWITDQDEIAPNPKQHNDAGHVIHHHICKYAPGNHGYVVFLTTEANLKSPHVEDLVAIPDLAAGALAEVFSQARLIGHRSTSPLCVPLMPDSPGKAALIVAWIGIQGMALRRVVVAMDADDAGGIDVQLVPIGFPRLDVSSPISPLVPPSMR